MTRRLLPIAMVVIALAAAPTAHAAPRVTTLYFANPGNDALTPVLQTTPDEAFHENTGTIAIAGNGFVTPETYATGRKLSFKVDVKRKVTGVVHVMCQQVIGVNTATQRNAGYVELAVNFKLDKRPLGSISISGPLLPTTTLSQAFEFSIPSALRNKTVSKVSADVVWTTTIGVCSISYSDPGRSTIAVPVR